MLTAASGAALAFCQSGSRGGRSLQRSEIQATFDGSFALLIGASRYQHWSPLPGVQADLNALKPVLEARGFLVREIIDPTSEDLVASIRSFVTQYGGNPNHRLLIYYAGHGHSMPHEFEGELGYVVPVDAPLPRVDPAGFRSKAVSMHQVGTWAHEIHSRHSIMIFDACFSGTLFDTFRSAPPDVARIYRLPTRQFITSGAARESVPDRSLFRRYLVQALEGQADWDNDRYVTGTELGLYLRKNVSRDTRGAQNPQIGTLPGREFREGDYVFWLPELPIPELGDQATLVLNALPESTVRVDGTRQETFPVLGTRVRSGAHDLRFEQENVSPLSARVELAAGDTLRCVAIFRLGKVECELDEAENNP